MAACRRLLALCHAWKISHASAAGTLQHGPGAGRLGLRSFSSFSEVKDPRKIRDFAIIGKNELPASPWQYLYSMGLVQPQDDCNLQHDGHSHDWQSSHKQPLIVQQQDSEHFTLGINVHTVTESSSLGATSLCQRKTTAVFHSDDRNAPRAFHSLHPYHMA